MAFSFVSLFCVLTPAIAPWEGSRPMTRRSTDSGGGMRPVWTNHGARPWSTASVSGGVTCCRLRTGGRRPCVPPGCTEAESGPGLTEQRCRARREPTHRLAGLDGALAAVSVPDDGSNCGDTAWTATQRGGNRALRAPHLSAAW